MQTGCEMLWRVEELNQSHHTGLVKKGRLVRTDEAFVGTDSDGKSNAPSAGSYSRDDSSSGTNDTLTSSKASFILPA